MMGVDGAGGWTRARDAQRGSWWSALRESIFRALLPPYPAIAETPASYFVYASAKTTEIGGRLSCPNVDAVILASEARPYRYFQFGGVSGVEHLPSVSLEHRVGLVELVASLFVWEKGAFEEYRFIHRIVAGLKRPDVPSRVRLVWVLRTFVLARCVRFKMRDLAEAHGEAYVSCFYSAMMLGVTMAFRRLGKPVWDIQHGHIGPTHATYNARVFSIACACRPTGLVVWDAGFGAYAERALGVSWATSDYGHLKLQQRPAGLGAQRHRVLYTLQTDVPIPTQVGRLIQAGEGLAWTLRLHPAGGNPVRDYEPLISLPHVAVSEEGASLVGDLEQTSVHLTWNSSVVHEAAAVGVPSIFMDAEAADGFQREVESGHARFVAPSDLRVEMLMPQAARDEASP